MRQHKLKRNRVSAIVAALAILTAISVSGSMCYALAEPQETVATFSIVASDSVTDELGIAVASRFFTVGNVVPWAKAGVGAVATQSYANTSFGWLGLDLMEQGLSAEETMAKLLSDDDRPSRRQVGIVAADGRAATFTGDSCNAWAGGRSGPNYAIQGNILAGETVVTEMERVFLATDGTLADRLYAALLAGEAVGGDSRGKQSAAMLVVKEGAGYGGYTDRAIDLRVDDHPEPFLELGRLLQIGQMNYAWNEAWSLFMAKQYAAALPHMEHTAKLAPEHPEVFYDLAVLRLAAGQVENALVPLDKSLTLNPKLRQQASGDDDLAALRGNPAFEDLLKTESK